MNQGERSLDESIREAIELQRAAAEGISDRRTALPLRYWRQAAHYTTPADDETMARKAIEGGTAPMARILARMGLTADDLAEALEVDPTVVEGLLDAPRRAPLVMIDGEDAQALRDDVIDRGLANAARLFTEADWSGVGPPTLRFFRPPGFALGTTARDLYKVLWSVGAGSARGHFALDGIVMPKIQHPEEVDLLYRLLTETEVALGLPTGHIRVAFLIESGWAVAQLAAIASRAAPRACALIFGLADYAADLGLPTISDDHPLATWARAQIVNVAGAIGVPAIDSMTLDYPVPDVGLGVAANRTRFLARMRLVFDDAIRAQNLGMTGKWVGHPAQLFAVLLAFDAGLGSAVLEMHATKIEAYEAAVGQGRGAMIIDGVMSDRATDRHARTLLRRAVAMGRFDAARALRLGVIETSEVAGLTASLPAVPSA